MTVQDHEKLAAKAIDEGAYEEAVHLLRPLAERNSEYALLALGWIYETGATGTLDKDVARSYYEHAASHGSATAHLNLGRLLLREGQEMEARAAFERGGQLGNDECRSELVRLTDHADEKLAAKAIEDGTYEEAVRLLRPLAERNSEYALLMLGWIYETGATGTLDRNVARSYYERAASQGSTAACFNLGRTMLAQGEDKQARTAFGIGAQREHIPCMAELGRMMMEGLGGPVDSDAGLSWLQKAAAQGHIFAQRTLLGIEERNAQSMSEKLSVKKRIAELAIKGAREIAKNPYSDKLR